MSNLSSLISKVVGGGTPSRAIESYWSGAIPWASVKDISASQRYLIDTEEHISPEGLKSSSCTLIPPGVPIIATRMAVGAVTIPVVPTGINQDLKGLFLNDDVDPVFVRYLILYLQEKISSVSVGSTVKGINVQDLLRIQIPETPDLKSQQKIAQILSSLDEQIELTEKLIEKKKAIQSGLLSKLFTPNQRWSTVNLEDISDVLTGELPKFVDDGPFPVYGANGIIGHSIKKNFNGGVSVGRVGAAGEVNFFNQPGWISDNAIEIKPKQSINNRFLFWLLMYINPKSLIAHSVQPLITQNGLKKLLVRLPEQIKLQEKVAATLDSSMDEINVESIFLKKLRLQKQGLMQDLLTGRVRVN
jgi:type I restriction enzyme S subunit